MNSSGLPVLLRWQLHSLDETRIKATHSNRREIHLAISNLKGAEYLQFRVRPTRSGLHTRNYRVSEDVHIPVMLFCIYDFMGFCWGALSAERADECAPRSFQVYSLSEDLAYKVCIPSENEIAKYNTSNLKIGLGEPKRLFLPSGQPDRQV